jgi:NTE family protein
MKPSFLFPVLFLLINISLPVYNQSPAGTRPKIGLVLSGGGAKGLAHIGALKVLEEAGIHPDYIAGTSMGGIVGGLYCIGYSANTLDSLARKIKWSHYLSDDISRRSITFEEKPDNDRFVLSIPFEKKGIRLPGGVINGQNIENLMNQLCAPVYNIRDFSKFNIPFLCNATDIETGKEVVFRSGYLPDALRATMSIPSLFDPIELNGKLLVDGGLVNNFPADRLREMGADIIIGVDVGFQNYTKDQLNSMFRIIEQALFFYGQSNAQHNAQLCNVLIKPSLVPYNAASFNYADSIIAIGEAAARKVLPRLKAIADSINSLYTEPLPIRVIVPESSDSIIISEISVEGIKRVSAELLKGKMQINVLDKVTPKDISNAIDRLYSSLYFEKVGYELQETGKNTVKLIIRVKENSEGFLRFGLHYDSNSKASILLNTTFRNLLLDGSKIAVNTALGENPYFQAEFFKNNGWKPGFGVSFQSSRTGAYYYRDTRRISSLNFYETKFQIYTQSVFRNSYALGGGIEFENSLIKPVIDPVSTIPESRYELINYYGYFQMDSYDNLFYPTRGTKINSGVRLITGEGITPVEFLHARISKAYELSDRFTLINHIYGGVVNGDSIPSQYQFFSGGSPETFRVGVMPFAGLDYMEIASRNILSMKLDLQVRFFERIYLTGTVNGGNFKNNFKELFTVNNIMGGYGLTAGYNSVAGPLELSISRSANHGGYEVFLRIGYWF